MGLARALFWLTTLVVSALLAACSGGERPDLPSSWSERGIASWYGGKFHGRATASGEIYDMEEISAAHKKLPFGTVVRIHNLDNGQKLDVRINDRGPFVRGRIIDLSRAAAHQLGMLEAGVARVRLTLVRGPVRTREDLRASPSEGLIVQVAAFRDRDRAERLAERVERDFKGASDLLSAKVYTDDGWHRVQFRDLESRDHAERLLRRLTSAGYSGFLYAP